MDKLCDATIEKITNLTRDLLTTFNVTLGNIFLEDPHYCFEVYATVATNGATSFLVNALQPLICCIHSQEKKHQIVKEIIENLNHALKDVVAKTEGHNKEKNNEK